MAAVAERQPPGRFGLPLLGETPELLRDTHGFFVRRVKAHGPVFRTHVFGRPTVVFSGPEGVAFFDASDAITRNGAALSLVDRLLGDTMLLIDGPEQRRRKALVMTPLAGNASDRAIPVVQRVVERYIERWEKLGSFVWRGENALLGFDLTFEILFGRPADGLEIKAVTDTLVAGLTSVPVALPFTRFGRAIKARDALRAFVAKELERPAGMLAEIAAARDARGEPFGPALVIEAVHLFFAMYNGIAVALTLLFKSLGQETERRARFAANVAQVMPDGPVTAAQVAALDEAERFTREVRRIHPINAITMFGNVTRPVSFGGFAVPAGWRAVAAIYATLIDPAVYPEPQRFEPGRFDPRCPMHARPDAYVAHGSGDHRCAGEALVTRVMVVAAALILRRHDWTLPPQDLEPNGDVFPTPRSGVRAEFFRRPAAA